MSILKTFGRLPEGEYIERTHRSNQFHDGAFQNIHNTPMMAKDSSFTKLLRDFFSLPPDRTPAKEIKSVQRELKKNPSGKNSITWFGHSSYALQAGDKFILVDPVFCGYASPFPFMVKSFKGTNTYHANDFKEIDLLILTHDHYDHLDYKTIQSLRPNVKKVICSLGLASHLVFWGYDPGKIIELDWWESAEPFDDIHIQAAPARHFSGRGLKRGQSLWSSFILQIKDKKIYLGGDSGYDTHFKEIGERFGPFDLAILECGQYNEKWPLIHMMPEETVQAGLDLRAKMVLPVHWGKFALAFHSWTEPVNRFTAEAKRLKLSYTTPMIGEEIILDEKYPDKEWWM